MNAYDYGVHTPDVLLAAMVAMPPMAHHQEAGESSVELGPEFLTAAGGGTEPPPLTNVTRFERDYEDY